LKKRKSVTTLQERLQILEQTNKNLIEDTTVQKTRIGQLEEELTKVTSEKEQIQSSYQRKIEVRLSFRKTRNFCKLQSFFLPSRRATGP